MKFKERHGDLQLESCDSYLCNNDKHTTACIVQWCKSAVGPPKEYNWVIAYWKKDKEGYNLIYVGDRPFDDSVSYTTFHYLAKYGQSLLDEEFEISGGK